MLSTGNHKKSLSLLASTVEDEGSFFLTHSGHSPKFAWEPTENLTLSEAKDYFIQFMSTEVLPGRSLPNKTIVDFYFGNGVTNANSNALRKRVGIAYGDAYMGCPTLEYVKALYRSSPETVKVFQWYFTAKMGALKFCPAWAGACHAEDMYPMFGMAFQRPDDYLPAERDISDELISSVKSFLRHG